MGERLRDFLEGAGSILDVFGASDAESGLDLSYTKTEEEAIREAFGEVGADLQDAMGQVDREHDDNS